MVYCDRITVTEEIHVNNTSESKGCNIYQLMGAFN